MQKILYGIFIIVTLTYADKTYKAGEHLYFAKGCANCHGTQAEGSAGYPKLANRPYGVIVQKLKNFKKGIATSHRQEIMFGFAKSLSKEEIQAIATYLSTHRGDDEGKYEISDDILGSVD